jgi:hypothetical protein
MCKALGRILTAGWDPAHHRIVVNAQRRTKAMPGPDFQDQPPQTPGLTEYDRKHLAIYARLLDAEEEGPSGPRWFGSSSASTRSKMPSAPVAFTTANSHAHFG